jgi:hypothetical protein
MKFYEKEHEMKKKIYSVDALAGAGKTYQAINYHLGLMGQSTQKILIVQPTIELINNSYEDAKSRSTHSVFITKIHSGTCDNVHASVMKHLKNLTPFSEVLLITHQTFLTLPYFPNKKEWIVVFDEIPNVISSIEINLTDSHKSITEHIETSAISNHEYGLFPKKENIKYLKQYARNSNQDEVYNIFMDFAEMLLSPNWRVSIKKDNWDRVISNDNSNNSTMVKLQAFGELNSSIFSSFKEVIIMSANFKESVLYLLWKNHIDFIPKDEIQNNLRWDEHKNSELITIKYLTDRDWSKSLRNKEYEYNGEKKPLGDFYIDKVRELMVDKAFLWSANKDAPNEIFIGMDGTRLSGSPHGLNQYQHIDNVVFLPALNPTPALFSFLKEAHIYPQKVICAFNHNSAYQAIMRCSIRNQENGNNKIIIVPSKGTAEWLLKIFPNATIEKIDGVPEVEPREKGGRPKGEVPAISPTQRKRLERTRNKQVEKIHEYLNCKKIGHYNKCHDNLYTYSSYRDILGKVTIFKLYNSDALMEIFVDSVDDYFNFLEQLATRSLEFKEGNLLISPSIFNGTRSRANVISAWSLIIDVDDTDLKPEDFQRIFPNIKMALMNTFSGGGRFRVIIPTSEKMDCDAYIHIQKAIILEIESNGFIDGKKQPNSLEPMHGIDKSKIGPESLFFLPCQAKNPDDSFFIKQEGTLLDTHEWMMKPVPIEEDIVISTENIKNIVEELSPEELVEKIDIAISKYHSISSGSGLRNPGFFNLAKRLSHLVPSNEIEGHLVRADYDGSRKVKNQIKGVIKSLASYQGRRVV